MDGRFIVAALAAATLLLSGCVGAGGSTRVGPGPSVAVGPDAKPPLPAVRLDVIVPVLDPNLPDDPDDYEDEGIWPELRRAEANRFAVNIKDALEDTGALGSVRVAPTAKATGDLYVLGKIDEADGEDIVLDIEVVDISGRVWLDKTYSHRVKEYFFRNLRNKGKDPYGPVFKEIAEDVVALLRQKNAAELAELRTIAELRFGASFSAETFKGYLDNNVFGYTKVAALPSENDRMLARIRAIRVRDQLFLDKMQSEYDAFVARMDKGYADWQEHSLGWAKAKREAQNRAIGQAILGVLSIAAAAASNNSTVQTAGVIAGIGFAISSFQNNEEAKAYSEELKELGRSIDVDLAPQVVAFEGRTVELTGTAAEQYEQWRAFLRKIYEEQAVSGKKL